MISLRSGIEDFEEASDQLCSGRNRRLRRGTRKFAGRLGDLKLRIGAVKRRGEESVGEFEKGDTASNERNG